MDYRLSIQISTVSKDLNRKHDRFSFDQRKYLRDANAAERCCSAERLDVAEKINEQFTVWLLTILFNKHSDKVLKSCWQNYSRAPELEVVAVSVHHLRAFTTVWLLSQQNQLSDIKSYWPKTEWGNRRWTSPPSLSKYLITVRWLGSSVFTMSSAETIWYQRQIDGESFHHLTL